MSKSVFILKIHVRLSEAKLTDSSLLLLLLLGKEVFFAKATGMLIMNSPMMHKPSIRAMNGKNLPSSEGRTFSQMASGMRVFWLCISITTTARVEKRHMQHLNISDRKLSSIEGMLLKMKMKENLVAVINKLLIAMQTNVKGLKTWASLQIQKGMGPKMALRFMIPKPK